MVNIIDQANTLIEQIKAAREGTAPLLDKLKDTNIPLGERWNAYTALVNGGALVKDDFYGDGFIDVLDSNLTVYDDFNIERHETCTFPGLYERIMEADGEWQAGLVKARDENLSKWQEAVLASGYSSFTYDW